MSVQLPFGSILNPTVGKYLISLNSVIFDYPCSDSTTCQSVSVLLNAGEYELSVWGASGGSSGTNKGQLGGRGGFSNGTISFRTQTILQIFIGGQGIPGGGSNYKESKGGFNGGGKGYSGSSADAAYGPSGGGSSDIRFENNSAFIIAGGGGGASFWNPYPTSNYSGGFGGGQSGGSGGDHSSLNCRGSGGTQAENGFSIDSQTVTKGIGRNGGNGKPGGGYGSGGGGGGYFGGGGGSNGGGGGGSGFVSPIFGMSSTFNGAQSFKAAKSNSDEIGHFGNGNAKITLLTPNKTPRKSMMRTAFKTIPVCTNHRKNQHRLKLYSSFNFILVLFEGIDTNFGLFAMDFHFI